MVTCMRESRATKTVKIGRNMIEAWRGFQKKEVSRTELDEVVEASARLEGLREGCRLQKKLGVKPSIYALEVLPQQNNPWSELHKITQLLSETISRKSKFSGLFPFTFTTA